MAHWKGEDDGMMEARGLLQLQSGERQTEEKDGETPEPREAEGEQGEKERR